MERLVVSSKGRLEEGSSELPLPMRPSPELRDLILGVYHDWSRGDPSWVDRLVSPDDITIAIGTDQEEWYVGGRNARAILRQQVQEGGERVFVPGDLHAYEDGSVGLIVDNPKVSSSTGKVALERVSLFLRKERGVWRVFHWHQSIGVPNVEAFGHRLTTSIDAVADLIEREPPDLSPIVASEGTVTIMFTDIESSTATNERLGDERWLLILREHNQQVRARVEAFGGTVVKSQGDGFVLAFPSARRAVECAIALQRGLEGFGASDAFVRVRMGLHTGEPVREADDIFGRDVAYAARVGAAAVGGQILVSSLVKSLTEPSGAFTFEGPFQYEFKGFEGPQSVFVIKWR